MTVLKKKGIFKEENIGNLILHVEGSKFKHAIILMLLKSIRKVINFHILIKGKYLKHYTVCRKLKLVSPEFEKNKFS